MFAFSTPGVHLVAPEPRPAVGRVSTDVAAFVGVAEEGPLGQPVRLETWREYLTAFGDLTPAGYLAYAVRAFFANGGRLCWVVRVTAENDAGQPGIAETRQALEALERICEVSLLALPDLHPKPRTEVRTLPVKPRCDVLEPEGSPHPQPLSQEERGAGGAAAGPDVPTQALLLQQELVLHCERMRDRVALLDFPTRPGAVTDPRDVVAWRNSFDSRYTALYFPWVAAPDPLRLEGLLRPMPGAGHVAGAIARSDLSIGVHKPPANEVLGEVEDLTFTADEAIHGELNSNGVNVIRSYAGRGIRIAGARTASSDPAWRFLNVRRLIIMIGQAIEEATQWMVFEPNEASLWQQVERVVGAFLEELWRGGQLDGATPEEAFNVVCDETTNPPQETAAGRLVCLVGVLPPYPAEYVIVRLGKSEGGIEVLSEEAAPRGAGHG